jgi:hypothetical protein
MRLRLEAVADLCDNLLLLHALGQHSHHDPQDVTSVGP